MLLSGLPSANKKKGSPIFAPTKCISGKAAKTNFKVSRFDPAGLIERTTCAQSPQFDR